MSMSAAPDASPGRVPLALETVAISKRFGAVHAVDALSLAIPARGRPVSSALTVPASQLW